MPSPRLAVPEGGLAGVGYFDPLRIGWGAGDVTVVPVPPLVGSALGVTLRRVLPGLLAAEWRDVEVAPSRSHRLITAAVDKVCAEHALAIPEEHVVAVPFVDAEIRVEAVCDGIPGHFPAHVRLQ